MRPTQEGDAPTRSNGNAKRRSWIPLIALSLAMFSVVLDSTMMNVAVGAIARDLNTQVTGVQAAISLYSLVMASLMLAGGKLGAIRGAASVFVVGCGVFGIGSLVAAFSPNLGILMLGWSIIEGIGAAAILPMAMVLIFASYEGTQRAIAFGVFGGVQATGAAVGPILGGFLTSFLTWRVGFGMHVVIMASAVVLGLRIAETKRDEDAKLDLVGTALSAVGLALVVLGVLLAGRYGFLEARRALVLGGTEIDLGGLSPTPILIALGIGVLVGFVHWQRYLQRADRDPLLRIDILRNGGFMAGASTDALRQLALAGLLFIVPVYAQSTLGFTAIQSGLAILPFSVAVFLLSMTTSGLASRIAPKWLILAGLGLFWIGIVVLRQAISTTMEVIDFMLPMIIMGVGIGLFVAQIVNFTISQVGAGQENEGSGTHNTFRELGSALGTAIIGAVLLTSLYSGLTDVLLRAEQIEVSPQEREQLAVELEDLAAAIAPEDGDRWLDSLSPGEQAQLAETVDPAQVDSMRTALTWTASFVLMGVLVGTFLPGRKKQDAAVSGKPKAVLK
jgi:EmrB/QacA subfamily drug resistance transporter